MSNKNLRFYMAVLVFCFSMLAAGPVFAGSAVVGSVAGGMNATIGGQPVLSGYTVFSGDNLKVRDGAAVVTMGKGSRAVFGRDSEASFLREGDNVTVQLTKGDVSLFQPGAESNAGLRVKIDNVTVGPASGFKTLGEVAMLDDSVVIRTKEGLLKVNWADGKSTEVAAGNALRLVPKTERAPQAAGGSQHFGGSANWVEYASLGAATVAAILAGIDISKANNASSNALAAESAANAANSTAGAALSAAQLANSSALAAGCALNFFVTGQTGQVSPFVPPSGETCP